ncbi:MAG: MFS transporter [Dehalococcoidia bacterium]
MNLFSAFTLVSFRWYMGAMLFWNAAMSMQMIVRGYLAYDLTGTFASLGIIVIGGGIPTLLISPFGGILADRFSKRLLLQIGQTFSLFLSLVVGLLVLFESLVFFHLVIASVVQGMVMSLVMPARVAILPEVVGLGRLSNAVPLNSAGMNLMQMIGPAIAGIGIDIVGAEFVYLLIALLYAFSVGMLFKITILSEEEIMVSNPHSFSKSSPLQVVDNAVTKKKSAWQDLLEGVRYLFRDKLIFTVLMFSFFSTFLGMPIRNLLPGYVSDVFGDSGTTLGILQMGMGIGALMGALVLANMKMRKFRGLLYAASAIVIGLGLISVSLTDLFVFGFVGFAIVGIGSAGRQAIGQILLQEYVDSTFRGRIMAIYMMQFSLMSFGSFGIALLMDSLGPQLVVRWLGLILVAGVFIYLTFDARLRKIE